MTQSLAIGLKVDRTSGKTNIGSAEYPSCQPHLGTSIPCGGYKYQVRWTNRNVRPPGSLCQGLPIPNVCQWLANTTASWKDREAVVLGETAE